MAWWERALAVMAQGNSGVKEPALLDCDCSQKPAHICQNSANITLKFGELCYVQIYLNKDDEWKGKGKEEWWWEKVRLHKRKKEEKEVKEEETREGRNKTCLFFKSAIP